MFRKFTLLVDYTKWIKNSNVKLYPNKEYHFLFSVQYATVKGQKRFELHMRFFLGSQTAHVKFQMQQVLRFCNTYLYYVQCLDTLL